MRTKNKVFKRKLLNISTKRVRLPNGYWTNLEIVKHPGAVLVIPLLSKNKVILLKQLRPVIGKYIYELVAGTLEKGENPINCARREIIEETGYRAQNLTKLGIIFPVPGYSTEKIVIYKAEDLKKVERKHQQDEIIDIYIITKKELKYLFKKGKIMDVKTISAFTICGWL